MLDSKDLQILFKVFNTINNFEDCEALDEFIETKELIANADYNMISSKDLRDYFIKKYDVDIE